MMLPPAIVFAITARASASTVPRAFLGGSGEVDVILPSAVLRAPDVRKQLTSGLTTVFLLSFDEKGVLGGARIEVRYELWDETYLVSAIDGDGKTQEAVLPSFERLVEWWTKTPLRMTAGPAAAPRALHLRLEAVPFSAGEQADAQRWLRQSMTEHNTPGTAGPKPSRQQPGGLLDVIIGTSVQRRAILTMRWTVTVEGGR
jgi:hypothetical protein